MLGYGALTSGLQPVNGQPFKERREPARGLGPRQFDYSYSVLAALDARRPGVQNRLVLTSIQVSPTLLRLVVIQLAGRPAFRTWPVRRRCMLQMHMHLSGI